MRFLFAPLLVALSFLTLLPVGVANPTEPEISRSRGWYPFVGLLYGMMLVGVVQLLTLISPVFGYTIVGMALLVIVPALVNRFLHLDGLMDFCDAMWGGRTAERRLEIMRDSRVGSFAVAGAFCVLLVKFRRAVHSDIVRVADCRAVGVPGDLPVVHEPIVDGISVRPATGYRQRVFCRQPSLVGNCFGTV